MAAGRAHGAYLLTAHRIRAGWGSVSEARWPYNGTKWPPDLPPGHQDFDRIASYNRIPGYFAIRNLVDAKLALANGTPFQLTVPTTKHWRDAKDGVIPLQLGMRPETSRGNHAIPIIGYDDNTRLFLFQNSWGVRWGDRGYGYLPYSYMRLHMVEAWAELGGRDVRPHLSPSTYCVGVVHCQNVLGYDMALFSLYGHGGEKVGWCSTTCRDNFPDIEEVFIKPGYHPAAFLPGLVQPLIEERNRTGLPLRFWLSHCDAAPGSYNHVLAINSAAGLDLTLRPSRERWAAMVAT